MIDDMQVYIANLGKYNEGELVGEEDGAWGQERCKTRYLATQ